jgi:hypothetical protein
MIWTSKTRQSSQPLSEFRRLPRRTPTVGPPAVQGAAAARAAAAAVVINFDARSA